MIVSELAKRAGVTAETVRYYTRSGLLTPKLQGQNGYRYYSDDDLKRLMFVRKAKFLGFELSEISEILNLSKNGNSPCPRVRETLVERIKDTRKKLKELKSLLESLENAEKKWKEMPDGMPDGNAVCHLIEGLSCHKLPHP